jgi:DHA2 family multidrug resistance protein
MNSDWTPRVNPWLIACSVMLATFMEVLDTSVANVSLPYIAGTLSASNSEATWVLTSYLVSNAIVLPASAWFGQKFGRTRFLTTCILVFTAASAWCGMAHSLNELILARILQGAGGGALQPMALAILLESFPAAKRGPALAVYGLGIVVAPVIGPTLGGWLTDNYSWRWIFYINVPVGILAYFLINAFVEDPPYIKNAKVGKLDWMGFALLSSWLATLQIVLDKGQEVDWFSTPWLAWFAVISVVSFVALIIWELSNPEPLIDLRVLANRNLAVATVMITVFGAVLYGSVAMLPLFLQTLLGYPALQSGIVTSPRGLGAVVGSIVIGRIIARMDGRKLVAAGFAGLALCTYWLSDLTLGIGPNSLLLPIILSGVSLSMVFVPLSGLATGTLRNEQIGQGSGLYSLMRNIGASIGISMSTTMVDRLSQLHQNNMVASLSPYSPNYAPTLAQIAHVLGGTVQATEQATGLIYQTLVGQASLLAFVSTFEILAVLSIVFVPLLALMNSVNVKSAPVGH